MDDLTLSCLFNGDADAIKHYKELRLSYEESLVIGKSNEENMELTDECIDEDQIFENDLQESEQDDPSANKVRPDAIPSYKFKPEFRHSNEILYEKDVMIIDSKQTALSEEKTEVAESSDDDLAVSMEEMKTFEEFVCGLPGCSKKFSDLESYESHYHSSHHFVCSVCKKAFVSDFMLQIHLEESHDSYFSVLCTRIDMYRCFIENCTEKFRTSDLRRDHCVKIHHLPSNFGFHKPLGSQQKSRKNKNSVNHSMEYEESFSTKSVPPKNQITENKEKLSNTKRTTNSVPTNICFGRGSQKVFEKKPKKKRINIKTD